MATDIGIDLGSSKTVIFSSSKVVLELPNVVTVDSETWEPVYYGEKAKQTIGRTPESLVCVTPIERGGYFRLRYSRAYAQKLYAAGVR